LLKLKHRYVVEPFNAPEFQGRYIVKLVVANSYPIGPACYIVSTREEITALMSDRITTEKGKIMLHYDMDNDTILSCCSLIYKAIREARFEIAKELNKKNNQGEANVHSASEISST
jgi:hypothetical protein